MAAFADGVIVGSAYVRELLEGRGADGVRALSEDLAAGRAAHDSRRPSPAPPRASGSSGRCRSAAYALCIVAGIVAAILITEKRWVARGGAPGDVLDIAVWAVPFGIIGGRLYHVISSPRAYFGEGGDPMRAFAIWEGGLGIWGAIALGGVGAWIACRRRGIPLPAFADALAPGLLVAQAIGRLGQLVQQRALRRPHRPAVGAGDLRVGRRPGGARPRRPAGRARLLPPDVPLRAAVEPRRRRLRDLGRPPVPARARPGLRPVRRRYCVGRLWIELLRTDPAEHFFGVRLNVFTAIVVGLGAGLLHRHARDARAR